MTTSQDPTQLFGPPPPGDVALFAGGSILATRTGVAAAAQQWAGGASDLDLDELSVELLEVAQQRPGPPDEHAAGRRASALMLAHRFPEALAALPAGLTLPPPGDDDLNRDHLVVATCRAALGDDDALVWLRQVAPMVSATDWAGYLAHCLLRVGDARGDLGLSEASLGQLQRLGDKGRRVLPRIVSDVIDRRPRARPAGKEGRARLWSAPGDNPAANAVRESAVALRAGTDLLHGASESFVSDPALVLDTAELLRMRGDRASAALLLHAVNRTNPHVARIEAALSAYVPRGARGRRRLRRALLLGLGAIAFLVSGVAGYPLIAMLWGIGIGTTEILAREPGLNRFDTSVLGEYAEKAGIRAFFAAPRSVADETPVGASRKVLPLVLGILALVLGIVIFPGARDAAASHGPSAGWVTSPGLSCFAVWILLFPVLVTWAASLVPGRRLGYAIPQLSAAQAECRCRRWALVSGPFALAYGNVHLTPVETPAPLRGVLERYGPLPPSVAGCATTGAAWLVLTLGPENGKVLLRSPLGTIPDPVESPEGLSTGQYL
ncbi:MAG: hypothetical protein ACRYG2_16670 [Janthinobacterium lividum]